MRDRIVAEAKTWLKTPWHHQGRVKGVGVDCAYLLVEVYSAVGLVSSFDLDEYPPDWHMHRDEPRFINYLKEYTYPVDEPLPGDIAMFKFGRAAAHGAIVMEWPLIIHAFKDERMVIISDASHGLAHRFVGAYRIKGL